MSALSARNHHAIVFGASGVSGWGALVQLTKYPTRDTFASITGLTNRPLSKSDALLPDDDRISLVSGVDLSGSPASVIQALKAKVPRIADVTTAFFFGEYLIIL